jgi:hypothetical protein
LTVVLGKHEVHINGQEVNLHVWTDESDQMKPEYHFMPFFTEQPVERDYRQTSPARITQGLLLQPTGKARGQFQRCGTMVIKGDDRIEVGARSWQGTNEWRTGRSTNLLTGVGKPAISIV